MINALAIWSFAWPSIIWDFGQDPESSTTQGVDQASMMVAGWNHYSHCRSLLVLYGYILYRWLVAEISWNHVFSNAFWCFLVVQTASFPLMASSWWPSKPPKTPFLETTRSFASRWVSSECLCSDSNSRPASSDKDTHEMCMKRSVAGQQIAFPCANKLS